LDKIVEIERSHKTLKELNVNNCKRILWKMLREVNNSERVE